MPALKYIPPLLPQLVERPPAGDGWLQIKYDGYRTQLVVERGHITAYSRTGHDWTDQYAPIIASVRTLKLASAFIDGEVAVQNEKGITVFGELRSAMNRAPHRLVFFAFDLLHLDARDLRQEPIEERRALLAELLADAPPCLQFSEAFEGEGAAIFAAADRMGLEGIVSKRKGSRYRSGSFSAWQKTKAFALGTYDVLGVELTSEGIPVAILAGAEGYVGNAMVTLPAAERDAFWRYVEAREAPKAALAGMRKRKATWVKPGLRARVKHLRGEGLLRHATLTDLTIDN